jgi:hypothetical protein
MAKVRAICAACQRPLAPARPRLYLGADGVYRGLCGRRCERRYDGGAGPRPKKEARA